MQKIKLIIFDCDGVLIDSEVLSMKVWIDLLAEYQITIDKNYFIEHFLGRRFSHVQEVIFKDFGLTVDEQLHVEFHKRLTFIFQKQLIPTEGIQPLLKSLATPFVVATSSSRARTQMAMTTTKLNQYIEDASIFTGEDVSKGKPAPDLFLLAAKSKGIAPENCLVIEDSLPGVHAAKAAKMQWIRYIGGSHMQACQFHGSNCIDSWQSFKQKFASLVTH